MKTNFYVKGDSVNGVTIVSQYDVEHHLLLINEEFLEQLEVTDEEIHGFIDLTTAKELHRNYGIERY